jgi:hypothetical protein
VYSRQQQEQEQEQEEQNMSICGFLQRQNVGYFYSTINFLSKLVDRQQVALSDLLQG